MLFFVKKRKKKPKKVNWKRNEKASVISLANNTHTKWEPLLWMKKTDKHQSLLLFEALGRDPKGNQGIRGFKGQS